MAKRLLRAKGPAKDMPTVRIGYADYTVEKMDGEFMDGCDVNGTCNNHYHRIIVADHLPPRREAETLLHEIIHGIFHSWGIEVGNEEGIVRPLTLGLASVILENPQTIDFILEGIDERRRGKGRRAKRPRPKP